MSIYVDVLPIRIYVSGQVRVGLVPLSHEISDKRQKQEFSKALAFYAMVYGMTAKDIAALQGKSVPVARKISEGQTILYAGAPGGATSCPIGKVVLFGWTLQMNFKEFHSKGLLNYEMSACTPGESQCVAAGKSIDENDDTRIWAVCGKEAIPEMIQVVEQTQDLKATASCPEGMKTSFGFALALSTKGKEAPNEISGYACRAGHNSCTMARPENANKVYIYLACFDTTSAGYDKIVSRVVLGAKNGKNSVSITCRDNSEILAGFSMEAHTHLSNSTVREKGFKELTAGEQTASADPTGVSKHRYFGVSDRHRMVAFGICGKPNEEMSANSKKEHLANEVAEFVKESELNSQTGI